MLRIKLKFITCNIIVLPIIRHPLIFDNKATPKKAKLYQKGGGKNMYQKHRH